MGDMADYYMERDLVEGFARESAHELIAERLCKGVWTTADGTTMKIKDMSDRHLENSARFFARRSGKSPLSQLRLELVVQEQARRAELKAEGDR